MAMLRRCVVPGCTTLTLGRVCVEHEQQAKIPPPPAVTPPVAVAK